MVRTDERTDARTDVTNGLTQYFWGLYTIALRAIIYEFCLENGAAYAFRNGLIIINQ